MSNKNNFNILLEQIGQSLVYNAIQNRNVVRISYNGDDDNIANGERIIEPYVLGRSNSNNIVLRAFQPYGDTASSVPDWKLFKLSNITYWKPTNETFNAPPEKRGFSVKPYNSNGDRDMKFIRAQVNFNGSNDVTNTDKGETNADNTRDNLVRQTNIQKANQQQKQVTPQVKKQNNINKNIGNNNLTNNSNQANINNKINYNPNQRNNLNIKQNNTNNKNLNNNTQNIQNNLRNDLDNRNQNNLNQLDNKIENGKQ